MSGDERAGVFDRLVTFSRLDQNQDQAVRRFSKRRTLRQGPAVGVGGGLESAHSFESLSQPLLNIRIRRREPCGLPQKRQRRGVISLGLERDRPGERVACASRCLQRVSCGRMGDGEHRPDQECRHLRADGHEPQIIATAAACYNEPGDASVRSDRLRW